MFTGIIEATAKILQKTDNTLQIERPSLFSDIKEGNSISVSGTCLSVTKFDQTFMEFDVVPETWSRTKFGGMNIGDSVNLERSLAANGRFEGHIVQGHVEAVGMVQALTMLLQDSSAEGSWQAAMLHIVLPRQLLDRVVFKGSIAIDGTSLTVANIDQQICSIALIPHTLEHTTLGLLKTGDAVNIETDVLGRYVSAMLSRSPSPQNV
ncbi:MAG: riboflavin synthase [Candidatus Peribacteria bacterium]|nr:riboflavin synthase [Candidatus Peribacteria bacterium]